MILKAEVTMFIETDQWEGGAENLLLALELTAVPNSSVEHVDVTSCKRATDDELESVGLDEL
jgi:hypothetical protein